MTDAATALFDLDGTITRSDTYLAFLLGFVVEHPRRLGRILPLPAAVGLHLAGRRDNTWLKAAFLRAVLGGLEREQLEVWTEGFLDRFLARRLRRRALEKIAWHRAAGDRLVLVTASLDIYAESLGRRLGFEDVLCTRTGVDGDGRLTGDLDGENCYGANKLKRVEAYLRTGAAGLPVTLYTDHHADLPLLRYVQKPVAVNPTRRLRRVATALGMPIEEWS